MGGQAADPRGKIVIIVDDGIATGASMLAAVRAVRAGRAAIDRGRGPGRARDRSADELAREADDVVCVTMPAAFEAVGQVYADFHQVSDDEVRELPRNADRTGWQGPSLLGGVLAAAFGGYCRFRRFDGSATSSG